MGWIHHITWFLCILACECWRFPRSEPPMHGKVESPQYPQPYPPGLLKQWELTVPEGYQIKLTIPHLDIEDSPDCYYDALTVLYNHRVLGKFCGQENSVNGHHPDDQPIVSPGNKLTLIFQTDDTNPELHNYMGFSAHYEAVDVDECSGPEPEDGSGPLCSQICHNTLGSYLCSCFHGYELRTDQRTCVLSCGGGIFDEPEGLLSSPGYPSPSPPGLSCQYIISVEPGFTVTLNFTDKFHIVSADTEEGTHCLHHWLQVTIPERETMKLCGWTSPGLMPMNANTVRLDYHTDLEDQSQGWSLEYSTQRVRCQSPRNIVNGRVTPDFREYFFRDYIHVRCDEGYKLMMDGTEISSYSAMCQHTGKWHLPLPECHIIDCGEPKPLLNGGVTFLSGSKNQYRSVIHYRCNRPFYALLDGANATGSYTCAADRKWRNDLDSSVNPVCVPVCGEPTVALPIFRKVIRGNPAPPNTIPWQAMLAGNGRGGGLVIGDRWVMTAAHNLFTADKVVPPETIHVHVGEISANTYGQQPGLPVASLHVHPNYSNPDEMSFNNDIALIKLQNPITFTASIMPICLPVEGTPYTTHQLGLVSGFGVTFEDGVEKLANELKFIRIPVVDQQTCTESINEEKKKKANVPYLSDNMFCAGVPESGMDTCQGDSGGAFALSKDGVYWAAGIVSWGFRCASTGRYGVYTKVVNYLDWVKTTMQDH